MKTMSIDLETYSSADISKTGVYRYSESPDFEILLFGYSIDGAPVQLVDLTCGERVPEEVRDALSDPSVTKWAFNASFERICLSRWLGLPSGTYLEPDQWRCSMIWSAYLGLPLSLAGVGAVLKLDKQKLDTGKDLIRYFCKPCRPTKKNGGRTRNLPRHDPGKWEQFKSYNLRDVETEMEIQKKLARFPVLPIVREWQQRPLEAIYAVVFLDAIHYHVRSEGQIVKKAVYIAIGIDLDGRKDVLGMWVGENESAKFWATVLNGLKNRGVEDIFIACTDNLTGFDAAIHATFPQTEIQNCILHQLRNSSRYVSYKDIKALMADLKAVYDAIDEQAALNALDTFGEHWDRKYPRISQSWRANWANLSTYFKYPQEVRRLIYTTNAKRASTASCAR